MSVLRAITRKVLSLRDAPEMARGAGAVLALQVAGAGLGYALQVLLARWMVTAAYGTYVYAVSWATLLATLGGLGFPTVVLRFIPEYTEQRRLGLLGGLLRTSRYLVAAATAALAAVGTVAAWLLHEPAGLLLAPLVAGLWTAPLLALVLLEIELLRARRRLAWAYAPMLVLRPLLVIGGGFLIMRVGGHLTALHVLACLAAALGVVWTTQRLATRRAFRNLLRDVTPRPAARRWLRVALPLLAAKGFLVLITKTDIFFIGALLSPERVGIYNAALRTAHAVTFVGFAVDAVAAPAIARRHAQQDRAALQALVTRLAHAYFWPALGLAALIFAASDLILGLFGPAFTRARPEMAVLMAGLLVNAGTGASVYLLTLTGHERRCARVYGWSMLLGLALNAIGVHFLGTLGAALATTATLITWSLWLHALAARLVGVQPSIIAACRTALRS